ncbi:hypothetical protein L2E82_10044 [Cichorium intybus]|uniref:Uncharacterized protein n=1 Tax=Cichorium intybus TaxID=13427 RepID=A0ACB9GAL7_CICIN|nr:hypothetical protein L2E82_10044 [Cichorium intybus]
MQNTRYSSLHSLPNQMEFTRISFSHRFHHFSPSFLVYPPTVSLLLTASNHSLGNSNNFFAIDVFGEKKILHSNSSASIWKSDFHGKLDNQNLGSRKDDIASGGNPSFVAKGGVSNRAVIEHVSHYLLTSCYYDQYPGHNGSFANLIYFKDELNWRNSEDLSTKTQLNKQLQREPLLTLPQQPATEDMVLYFKNPRGVIQGPFTGGDLMNWFQAEYFEADVLVHLANAPQYSLFNWLGDIMPQMCEEAKPSLDLSAAKQSEVYNNSSKSSFNLKENETRFQQGSDTEAENMFIKSLIFRKMLRGINDGGPLENFGLFEDTQGYFGNSNSVLSDNRDKLCRLTKRIQAERQDPQPLNLLQYQHWSQIKHQRPISTQQLSIVDEDLVLKQPQQQQDLQTARATEKTIFSDAH